MRNGVCVCSVYAYVGGGRGRWRGREEKRGFVSFFSKSVTSNKNNQVEDLKTFFSLVDHINLCWPHIAFFGIIFLIKDSQVLGFQT